ncbi:MAG: SCO family protein [Actinomycetia bacterium]|nr:SCO family protein [Actinomycetes bacterium]
MSVTPDTELDEPPEPVPAHGNTRVRNAAILVTAVAVVLGAIALLTSGNDPSATEWAGRVLPEPEDKPAIALADTDGNPFDLRADTDGRLTLLMFGYANCPDVCPISLGTLQSALEELDPAVANNVEMVFVTADPERDTAAELRDYLDGYNRDFVGLWGTTDEIDEAQRLANVPPAVRETPDEDGNYTVGHASQIIAYQDDGIARIVYPFGTRQQDWVRDLPRLVAGEQPAA